MSEVVVDIEKLAFGGAGIGRVDGKACFVPYTAPGDRVRARVVREKRSYLEAELREVLEPGPDRVPPPCPVFGTCGGCDWQHVAYERQLLEKQRIFADTLWRIARVEAERVLPIAAAPEPYGYRSRLQLKLRYVSGELHIGFYRAGSHFVVNIPDRCAVAHPAINGLIACLRSCLVSAPEPDRIPQIDLAVGDDGGATMIFHYIGDRHREMHGFLERTRHAWPVETGIFLQSGRKSSIVRVGGRERLDYRLSSGNRDLKLSFSAGGFSQVNYAQNRRLVGIVLDWLELSGQERILDLYCGNGNFSLPLASSAASVVGLEIFAASIADAVANARANGVTNVSLSCLDAADEIKRLATAGEKFDIVLLDPPRAGAADLVGFLPALEPSYIIYVSCDPPTLARDLATLKKSGYGVVKSCPVDMFPHTYHTESVTLVRPEGTEKLSGEVLHVSEETVS
jgi:23S rRNA (uracil1939-C5)-methyltransferase